MTRNDVAASLAGTSSRIYGRRSGLFSGGGRRRREIRRRRSRREPPGLRAVLQACCSDYSAEHVALMTCRRGRDVIKTTAVIILNTSPLT